MEAFGAVFLLQWVGNFYELWDTITKNIGCEIT
jgi:hypothetical protein